MDRTRCDEWNRPVWVAFHWYFEDSGRCTPGEIVHYYAPKLGVSKSTLYAWLSGEAWIPLWAARRLIDEVAARDPEGAIELHARATGAKARGWVTLLPESGPADDETIDRKERLLFAEVGDLARWRARAAADGRTTAREATDGRREIADLMRLLAEWDRALAKIEATPIARAHK